MWFNILEPLKSKKKYETTSEILFEDFFQGEVTDRLWKWKMTTIFLSSWRVVEYFSTVYTSKKTGDRTEPFLAFGLNVTTQNLHSVHNYWRTYETC